MAVDFNVDIHKAGVQDIIQQSLSRDVQEDFNKEDPAEAARKKLDKKIQIKKDQLKQTNVQRETFSREQQVNQKMAQLLGGAAGPETAEALRGWQNNADIQQKLTDAQKQLFREAMAKNPPKATKAAQAMEQLTRQPEFKSAVKSSQQMGTLQKALLENPEAGKAAGDLLKSRFMQSPRSDAQTKSRFMEFGLRQASRGNLQAAKKAGDMLGTLTRSNVGRAGQRAAMNMVQRNPQDAKAMGNVDRFVQDPHVQKLPSFARTKSTELLAKAGGKEEVADGFRNLAADGKFKAQTAQNKGRFFATIGTGRPSEFRAITDTLLSSLQNPGFPKRSGQVGKFLREVSKQVQTKGAASVDAGAAMKKAKSSSMPTLTLVKMDPENMSEEELAAARSQNRANVMQYYQKLSRMYEGGEKQLKAAKYLEDVNKLPNLRPPEEPDLSALTPEERAFIQERHSAVLKRHQQLQTLQRQRSRELRTKRRRGGKAGVNRTRARQPRYFTPSATRGGQASKAFLQATGTDGAPQGLPRTPQQAARAGRMAGGGDIQQQVSAALQNLNLGQGGLTAEKAGQVAQAIASQVAQQVAAQVTETLLGSAAAAGQAFAPAGQPAQPAAQRSQAPKGQQGKVDGWGIPRTFERDLGGVQHAPVKPPSAEGDLEPDPVAIANETYTGKMLVKDPSSIRGLEALFATAWKELNKGEVALLKNLGWNQQLWDTKDTPAARWPGAMMTAFINLTPHQREAVRKLGFTPHSWDKRVQAFSSGRNA